MHRPVSFAVVCAVVLALRPSPSWGDPPPVLSSSPARPRLVFRSVLAGMLDRNGVMTYTVARDGEGATLVVSSRQAPDLDHDELVETFTGRATEQGDALTLDFVANGGPDFVCTRRTVSAAQAGAVRVRSPGAQGDDCGDPGVWSPARTTRVRVWACREGAARHPAAAVPVGDAWERENAEREALRTQLTFGDAPGIEYVRVNDDCVIQGGGLRLIPADGSVRRADGAMQPR